MMVILMIKLLIFQLTMQVSMATTLEGRTAHYVDIVDTPTEDESAQRLTCPIFSIRPANRTTKFFKYIASENQFNKTDDWTERGDAANFKQCANIAASENFKMFMFDENECKVSNSLYTRQLPEPCGDETATVVYMVEANENSCVGEYSTLLDGSADTIGSVCDSDNSLTIKCDIGVLHANDSTAEINYGLFEGECFKIVNAGDLKAHDEQSQVCGSKSMVTCKPPNYSGRDTFFRRLSTFSTATGLEFLVDLAYDTDSLAFIWGSTGIDQPTDDTGGWDVLDPTYETLSYAYLTPSGLVNGVKEGTVSRFRYICCQ